MATRAAPTDDEKAALRKVVRDATGAMASDCWWALEVNNWDWTLAIDLIRSWSPESGSQFALWCRVTILERQLLAAATALQTALAGQGGA